MDSAPPYLQEMIVPNNVAIEGSICRFLSDTITRTIMENIIARCELIGVCADIETQIGQYLLGYELPSYVDSSTCSRTIDYFNFFSYYQKFFPNRAFDISLYDNYAVGELTQVYIIDVSEGVIKVRKPQTGTTGTVCIIVAIEIFLDAPIMPQY